MQNILVLIAVSRYLWVIEQTSFRPCAAVDRHLVRRRTTPPGTSTAHLVFFQNNMELCTLKRVRQRTTVTRSWHRFARSPLFCREETTGVIFVLDAGKRSGRDRALGKWLIDREHYFRPLYFICPELLGSQFLCPALWSNDRGPSRGKRLMLPAFFS